MLPVLTPARLVLIRNQQVSGSNPLVGSSSNPEKSGFYF